MYVKTFACILTCTRTIKKKNRYAVRAYNTGYYFETVVGIRKSETRVRASANGKIYDFVRSNLTVGATGTGKFKYVIETAESSCASLTSARTQYDENVVDCFSWRRKYNRIQRLLLYPWSSHCFCDPHAWPYTRNICLQFYHKKCNRILKIICTFFHSSTFHHKFIIYFTLFNCITSLFFVFKHLSLS